MQAAPYDFLQVDDDLSQEQLDSARAQMSMWTAEGCYPLLPYSSIVLEAVPEQQSQKGRPAAAAQSRQALPPDNADEALTHMLVSCITCWAT